MVALVHRCCADKRSRGHHQPCRDIFSQINTRDQRVRLECLHTENTGTEDRRLYTKSSLLWVLFSNRSEKTVEHAHGAWDRNPPAIIFGIVVLTHFPHYKPSLSTLPTTQISYSNAFHLWYETRLKNANLMRLYLFCCWCYRFKMLVPLNGRSRSWIANPRAIAPFSP